MSTMKKLIFLIFTSFLINNLLGQDKLFLARKSDPLIYSPSTKLGGDPVKLFIPSVSSDGKYLSIELSTLENDYSDVNNITITYSPASVLIDMGSGEIIKRIKNSRLLFIDNQLIKSDYDDIYGHPFAPADISLKMNTIDESVIDPSTFEIISKRNKPTGLKDEQFIGMDHGYFKMAKIQTSKWENYTALYKLIDNEMSLVGKFEVNMGIISEDGQFISGSKQLGNGKWIGVIYNISTGNLIREIEFKKNENPIQICIVGNKYILTTYVLIKGTQVNKGFRILDLNTAKTIKDFPGDYGILNITAEPNLIMVTKENGQIRFFDTNTLSFAGDDWAFKIADPTLPGATPIPVMIGNGDYFIIGQSSGISKLVSVKDKKVIADIYVDEDDWAVVSVDGRMDGTAGAFEKLEWRKYSVDNRVTSQLPLDITFEKNYTPRLLSLLLNGNISNSTDLSGIITNIPKVKIVTPSGNSIVTQKEVEITINAIPTGDPIREIQLFVNDKLLGGNERGFKVAGQTNTFTVTLAQGVNHIAAKAISIKGFESAFDRLEITYKGEQASANLYIFAIGINIYENPAYNLNYAVADATAVVDKIKSNVGGIFKDTQIHTLYDSNAKRDAIIAQLNDIASASQPQDVFIFYYAGHGVIDEASNDFYLALNDVTQLYGKSDLLTSKGISSKELKDYFSKIKAQKQLIILDACQSGGAINTFAMRGAAEEKALIQLARSSGVVLLASTENEQFASEFNELGHGVFTYSLLEGLDGKADGGQKDHKITVKELEAFINDNIPTLSSKYKGQPQYPKSWSMGQDFPIVITKTE
jgi:hypothetical protein